MGYFFLNILSILSVTINPPTTFTVANITDASPSHVPKSPPTFVEIIAPTIAIPDIALENEIANEHRDIDFLFVGHFDDPRKNVIKLLNAVNELGI